MHPLVRRCSELIGLRSGRRLLRYLVIALLPSTVVNAQDLGTMGPSSVPGIEALAGLILEAETVDPVTGQRSGSGARVETAAPLADAIAQRIEQLQALRDQLGEAAEAAGAGPPIEPLPPSASAPPRMDSGDPNPDRLGDSEAVQ